VRWDIRGDQTQRNHDRTAKDNGDGAFGWQVANQTGDHTFCPKCQGCSEGEARANRPQRIAKYHAHYIASRRAKRHAHADLVRALGHRVRQQSVEPDGRKQRAQRAKPSTQRGGQPFDESICSFMVMMRTMGTVFSTADSVSRTMPATASGAMMVRTASWEPTNPS